MVKQDADPSAVTGPTVKDTASQQKKRGGFSLLRTAKSATSGTRRLIPFVNRRVKQPEATGPPGVDAPVEPPIHSLSFTSAGTEKGGNASEGEASHMSSITDRDGMNKKVAVAKANAQSSASSKSSRFSYSKVGSEKKIITADMKLFSKQTTMPQLELTTKKSRKVAENRAPTTSPVQGGRAGEKDVTTDREPPIERQKSYDPPADTVIVGTEVVSSSLSSGEGLKKNKKKSPARKKKKRSKTPDPVASPATGAPPPPPPLPKDGNKVESEKDKKLAFEKVRALLSRVNPRANPVEDMSTPRHTNTTQSQRGKMDPSPSNQTFQAQTPPVMKEATLSRQQQMPPTLVPVVFPSMPNQDSQKEQAASSRSTRETMDPPSETTPERVSVDAPASESTSQDPKAEVFPVRNTPSPKEENMDFFEEDYGEETTSPIKEVAIRESTGPSKFVFDDESSHPESPMDKIDQSRRSLGKNEGSMRLRVLQSTVAPRRGPQTNPFESSNESAAKDEIVGTKSLDIDSSDDEIPAPAIDTEAMLAALESTLPPRAPSLGNSSPRRKSRARRKKSSSGVLTESNDAQKSFNQKATSIAEKHAEKKRLSAGRARAEKRLSGAKALGKSSAAKQEMAVGQEHMPTSAAPPYVIDLTKDDPISDLDHSVRNFPIRQVKAEEPGTVSGLDQSRDDVESASQVEDEAEEDDRYAPLFTSLTPQSPVGHITGEDLDLEEGDRQVETQRVAPGVGILADEITEWTGEGGTAAEGVEMIIQPKNVCDVGAVLACLGLDEPDLASSALEPAPTTNLSPTAEHGDKGEETHIAGNNQAPVRIFQAEEELEELALEKADVAQFGAALISYSPTSCGIEATESQHLSTVRSSWVAVAVPVPTEDTPSISEADEPSESQDEISDATSTSTSVLKLKNEPSGIIPAASKDLTIPPIPFDPTGMLPLESGEDGSSYQESRDMSDVPQPSPEFVELNCGVEASDSSRQSRNASRIGKVSKVGRILAFGQQAAALSPTSKVELVGKMGKLDRESRYILQRSIELAEHHSSSEGSASSERMKKTKAIGNFELIDLTSYASLDEVDEAVWLFDVPAQGVEGDGIETREGDLESLMEFAGVKEGGDFLSNGPASALDSLIEYGTTLLLGTRGDKETATEQSKESTVFVPTLSTGISVTDVELCDPKDSGLEIQSRSLDVTHVEDLADDTPQVLFVVEGKDAVSVVHGTDVEATDDKSVGAILITDATPINSDSAPRALVPQMNDGMFGLASILEDFTDTMCLSPASNQKTENVCQSEEPNPPREASESAIPEPTRAIHVPAVYPEKLRQRPSEKVSNQSPVYTVISVEDEKSRASTLTEDHAETIDEDLQFQSANRFVQIGSGIAPENGGRGSRGVIPATNQLRFKPSPEHFLSTGQPQSNRRTMLQLRRTPESLSVDSRNPRDACSTGDKPVEMIRELHSIEQSSTADGASEKDQSSTTSGPALGVFQMDSIEETNVSNADSVSASKEDSLDSDERHIGLEETPFESSRGVDAQESADAPVPGHTPRDPPATGEVETNTSSTAEPVDASGENSNRSGLVVAPIPAQYITSTSKQSQDAPEQLHEDETVVASGKASGGAVAQRGIVGYVSTHDTGPNNVQRIAPLQQDNVAGSAKSPTSEVIFPDDSGTCKILGVVSPTSDRAGKKSPTSDVVYADESGSCKIIGVVSSTSHQAEIPDQTETVESQERSTVVQATTLEANRDFLDYFFEGAEALICGEALLSRTQAQAGAASQESRTNEPGHQSTTTSNASVPQERNEVVPERRDILGTIFGGAEAVLCLDDEHLCFRSRGKDAITDEREDIKAFSNALGPILDQSSTSSHVDSNGESSTRDLAIPGEKALPTDILEDEVVKAVGYQTSGAASNAIKEAHDAPTELTCLSPTDTIAFEFSKSEDSPENKRSSGGEESKTTETLTKCIVPLQVQCTPDLEDAKSNETKGVGSTAASAARENDEESLIGTAFSSLLIIPVVAIAASTTNKGLDGKASDSKEQSEETTGDLPKTENGGTEAGPEATRSISSFENKSQPEEAQADQIQIDGADPDGVTTTPSIEKTSQGEEVTADLIQTGNSEEGGLVVVPIPIPILANTTSLPEETAQLSDQAVTSEPDELQEATPMSQSEEKADDSVGGDDSPIRRRMDPPNDDQDEVAASERAVDDSPSVIVTVQDVVSEQGDKHAANCEGVEVSVAQEGEIASRGLALTGICPVEQDSCNDSADSEGGRFPGKEEEGETVDDMQRIAKDPPSPRRRAEILHTRGMDPPSWDGWSQDEMEEAQDPPSVASGLRWSEERSGTSSSSSSTLDDDSEDESSQGSSDSERDESIDRERSSDGNNDRILTTRLSVGGSSQGFKAEETDEGVEVSFSGIGVDEPCPLQLDPLSTVGQTFSLQSSGILETTGGSTTMASQKRVESEHSIFPLVAQLTDTSWCVNTMKGAESKAAVFIKSNRGKGPQYLSVHPQESDLSRGLQSPPREIQLPIAYEAVNDGAVTESEESSSSFFKGSTTSGEITRDQRVSSDEDVAIASEPQNSRSGSKRYAAAMATGAVVVTTALMAAGTNKSLIDGSWSESSATEVAAAKSMSTGTGNDRSTVAIPSVAAVASSGGATTKSARDVSSIPAGIHSNDTTGFDYTKSEEEPRVTIESGSASASSQVGNSSGLSISTEPPLIRNAKISPSLLSRVERVRAMVNSPGRSKDSGNVFDQLTVSSEPESLTASPKRSQGRSPSRLFSRTPRLQSVLDRLRKRQPSRKSFPVETPSVCSTETEPVDVDELFSRYDSIVKNMNVNDEEKLEKIQERHAVQRRTPDNKMLIDVTRFSSDEDDRSKEDFSVSELRSSPKGRSSLDQRTPRQLMRKSSSFGSVSEFSVTPSQKARDLRKQLDQALKTSAAIRNTQERLNNEISTFKSRLQRNPLSPKSGSPRTIYKSPREGPTAQGTSSPMSANHYVSLSDLKVTTEETSTTDIALKSFHKTDSSEESMEFYLSPSASEDDEEDGIRSQQLDSILNGLRSAQDRVSRAPSSSSSQN
jgi:hypothetical protein